ncbi:MAG TPA: ABC transporter transmembrane domain-containing protein, partial [Hyphomicrobiales bacterium]|nr:ABC transporter transmembrane domain-containing protein [Hyphomicrobiales bacterium]
MNDRTGRLDIEAEEAQPALQQRAVAGNLRGLGKLWPYIRPYKLSVVLAFIGLVIAAGATLSLPVAVRRMIDLGFSGDNAGLINSYFAMLLVIAAILAGASAMRFYFVSWIGERVVSDIRTSVFAHLTTLSPAFYERTHSAELMSRLTADTTQIKAAVSSAVSQLLRNAFLLVG